VRSSVSDSPRWPVSVTWPSRSSARTRRATWKKPSPTVRRRSVTAASGSRLHDQPAAEAVAQPAPAPAAVNGRRAELTHLRWAEVHALWDKGIGNTAISRALNLDEKTVRRYAQVTTAEELLTQVPKRGSALDTHVDYLARHWQEGCTNAAILAAELRERGYRGGQRSVRRRLQTWRTGATPPTATPVVTPKPREVTGWIIRPAVDRTESDQADLTRILERCPVLRTVDQLVSDFGGMLRQRRGQHLDRGSPGQRCHSPPRIRRWSAQGLRRRPQRTHPHLEQRRSRGNRHDKSYVESGRMDDHIRPV
jgi:hypothetical protein